MLSGASDPPGTIFAAVGEQSTLIGEFFTVPVKGADAPNLA
jgi:hypothetical protein